MKVTAEAARRFLVARHFLAPARSLTGLEGVLEVFRRLGSIQFDPIAAAGRNHDYRAPTPPPRDPLTAQLLAGAERS